VSKWPRDADQAGDPSEAGFYRVAFDKGEGGGVRLSWWPLTVKRERGGEGNGVKEEGKKEIGRTRFDPAAGLLRT
jgi:hypothetical protein